MLELPASTTAFRHVTRNYATGIAVVTTRFEGADHAMTANSFTTVSLDPLLVSVCVQQGTRFHEAVTAAGFWAASFLADSQVPLARWFATRGRPLADQFAQVPTTRTTSGALLLIGALAGLTAQVEAAVPAGDHDILVSRVSSLHDGDPSTMPTVYFRSAYGSWSHGDPDAPTI